MLVANSFDLWQKDTFFSAAEEVQESADIMESAYRRWVRERKERLSPENLNELSRDLQTTLGTAKWQLEEFERAVRLSYGHRGEDNSTTRHSQFISAIGSQISRVELALRESFCKEGKKPLRWVNLDEEECNDLAAFLSGTSQITHTVQDEIVLETPMKFSIAENPIKKKDPSLQSSASSRRVTYDEKMYFKEDINANKDVNYAMEETQREDLGSREDIICHVDKTSNTRTWSTQNLGELRIVVAEDNEEKNKLMLEFEGTPKEKGSKLVLWKKRCGELSLANGAVNLFNQVFCRVSGSQRQFHNPPRMRYGRIQVTLVLMLTIFLIVPFLLYSN